MEARVTRRRFTVHEYHRAAAAGIRHEENRVELIEMAAIGTRHSTCANGLNRLLVSGVGDEAIVRAQNAVRLGEYGKRSRTWR